MKCYLCGERNGDIQLMRFPEKHPKKKQGQPPLNNMRYCHEKCYKEVFYKKWEDKKE